MKLGGLPALFLHQRGIPETLFQRLKNKLARVEAAGGSNLKEVRSHEAVKVGTRRCAACEVLETMEDRLKGDKLLQNIAIDPGRHKWDDTCEEGVRIA